MVKSVRRVQGKKEDIQYILTLGLRALQYAFIIRKKCNKRHSEKTASKNKQMDRSPDVLF